MAILNVEVTQDDINKGCMVRAFNCPISIAVSRAYGYRASVGVCRRTIEFIGLSGESSGDILFVVKTPRVAADFVSDFDGDRPVATFAFTLVIPDQYA